jgi:hypothetical protein
VKLRSRPIIASSAVGWAREPANAFGERRGYDRAVTGEREIPRVAALTAWNEKSRP